MVALHMIAAALMRPPAIRATSKTTSLVVGVTVKVHMPGGLALSWSFGAFEVQVVEVEKNLSCASLLRQPLLALLGDCASWQMQPFL